MSSILSVGQTALNAAQAGLVTTGHNIANANTAGYTRQVVVQGAADGQDAGYGYIGKGTEVVGVQRVYDEFLSNATLSAQVSKGQLDSYYSQIRQVNNMLADSTSGLSPVLQDFFNSAQTMSSDPSSAAARQAMLSSASTLVGRFQGINAQLDEMRQGVNTELRAGTDSINTQARQIAKLNDLIEKAHSTGSAPNDLLDQRDQAVSDLAREIKVSVVKQGNIYNVLIGNGQPLVVNTKTYDLSVAPSATDPARMEIAYKNSAGQPILLAEDSITGGKLGGLIDFRARTLDPAQNALGRIAITLGAAVNGQQALGNDAAGAAGKPFFTLAQPVVTPSSKNADPSAAAQAAISDPGLLTGSDYQLQVEASPAGSYSVRRLSDNQLFTGSPPSLDGVDFSITGTLTAGDQFLIRPTVAGASASGGFGLALTDPRQIAAASAISATAASGNTGTGRISAGTVAADNGSLRQPVSITFTSATSYSVSGGGLAAANLAYTPGSDISYNGWTVQISGTPASGDAFSIGPTSGAATGDNRNALAMARLQTASTTGGLSFQGAYSQLVSQVGNKTQELQTTSAAADQQYDSANAAQQSVSGVNLDEEAANLLRYQQAYQAAGKVMKAASDMFQVLLSLGAN
jgi:flagellar hook-associated protein 1 FlgK